MSMITGGELVIRTLLQEGVTHTYLLYGGHLQPICESIRAHEMSYVDVRNEVAAGYAAEGYARASGKFGVAMVSAAPAFTNILTSIAQAFTDRTPVVYISTSARLCDAETNFFMSGIDPIAMAKPVTKWAHCVTATEDIPRLLAHAIRVATNEPTGPTLLDIPWDVVHGLVDEDEVVIPKNIRYKYGVIPHKEQIDNALSILSDARRPVIIAGEGACLPGVAEELRNFIKVTNMPVFSNYDGIGLIPADDPLYGGAVLKLTEFKENDAPDAVLALGVRFGFLTVGNSGVVPETAKVIQVDFDPKEMYRTKDVDVPIVANTVEFLTALNAHVGQFEWANLETWVKRISAAKKSRLLPLEKNVPNSVYPIPPYEAAKRVVRAAGDDVIYVGDGADAHMWFAEIAQQTSRSEPCSFFAHKSFFGSLGFALGFSIGVQNIRPNKRIICIMGDGALGFSLSEFHTLSKHKIPVIVVVMNNKAFGATSHYQKHFTIFGKQESLFATDLSGAEYHQVAKALGCYGVLVKSIDQIEPAVKSAIESGQPACINIEIGVEDIAPDHLNIRFTD